MVSLFIFGINIIVMEKFDKSIMDDVVKLSIESVENNGGPFSAAIVRNGKIIATGVNRVTAHHDPTAHAEVMAIRNACEKLNTFDLSDCQIYSSCEPCPMCLGAIYWARIPELFYANTQQDAKDIDFDDSFIYEEMAKKPEDRALKMVKVDNTGAIEAFRLWARKEDKTKY